MGVPIPLRGDIDAVAPRLTAKVTKHAAQARHPLAFAAIDEERR